MGTNPGHGTFEVESIYQMGKLYFEWQSAINGNNGR
jgi:hypothetical protein